MTASAAQRAYRDGVSGWYTVNEATGIPVAGPFATSHAATAAGERIKAEPPFAPVEFVAVQVGADHVA